MDSRPLDLPVNHLLHRLESKQVSHPPYLLVSPLQLQHHNRRLDPLANHRPNRQQNLRRHPLHNLLGNLHLSRQENHRVHHHLSHLVSLQLNHRVDLPVHHLVNRLLNQLQFLLKYQQLFTWGMMLIS